MRREWVGGGGGGQEGEDSEENGFGGKKERIAKRMGSEARRRG